MTATTTDSAALAATHLAAIPCTHEHFLRARTDWTDQASIHRAVMGLYPRNLDGPADQRRATARILYRLDTTPAGQRLVIQSAIPITAKVATPLLTTTLQGLAGSLKRGARFHVRVDLNAVRTQSRTGKRLPIPPADLPEYLVNSTGKGPLRDAFKEVEIVDLSTSVRRVGQTPQHVAHVTANTTINDTDTVTQLVLHGSGRAKAYGCGLLSVIPLNG